tara:strand:+ start:98 stop:595 length:498 start_codon:yes stop_codon:yes gene_type:complete
MHKFRFNTYHVETHADFLEAAEKHKELPDVEPEFFTWRNMRNIDGSLDVKFQLYHHDKDGNLRRNRFAITLPGRHRTMGKDKDWCTIKRENTTHNATYETKESHNGVYDVNVTARSLENIIVLKIITGDKELLQWKKQKDITLQQERNSYRDPSKLRMSLRLGPA